MKEEEVKILNGLSQAGTVPSLYLVFNHRNISVRLSSFCHGDTGTRQGWKSLPTKVGYGARLILKFLFRLSFFLIRGF